MRKSTTVNGRGAQQAEKGGRFYVKFNSVIIGFIETDIMDRVVV